ncbi:MAG TPA: peptidylprolyl isomerase [Candidatus Saccharimonadales bacterium]|nr:peptidylprolyl isomerase [Candidatus Saccharimonadales bacterium]
MKKKLKHLLSKRPSMPSRPRLGKKEPEKSLQQAIQGIPRITNETVAEHREEVLSSARKYIYPLQHSAHRVVIISSSLLILVVVVFFTYCLLSLYKFQSSSTFVYRVTQVIPFPVAKAGPRYVAYENYLFELRHYIHYYQTQQRVDFDSDSGKQQLTEFRKRAMDRVVNDAYVKELAREHNVKVTDRELDDAIRLVRSQNRLGSNDQVFEDVLKEFWGWSVSDFKRELKQQMLTQKVVSTLDTDTHKRAEDVYQRLKNGEDFATLAKQSSDDVATRENGGDYGFSISQSDRDLPPQVIDSLFRLKTGETSSIINTGSSLEIIKLNESTSGKVRASHIMFTFKSIDTYIDPLKNKDKPRIFISD